MAENAIPDIGTAALDTIHLALFFQNTNGMSDRLSADSKH